MNLPVPPREVGPLPRDPLGKRLCQIFSYAWNAIVKTNDSDSTWQTITKHPLAPRELWMCWQDANQIVGTRFDSKTVHGLIDLDVTGMYHPKQEAEALPLMRAALETIGITRTFLTQSSFSGGLHLWIPLPKKVPTFWLGVSIRQCLEAQGFIIKQGQLEIFPNQKAYARKGEFTQYQGHRLPLQPATGSQLLDNDLQPVAGGLERFFELWDQCAVGQDMEQVQKAIAQAQKNHKKRWTSRNSSVVDTWRTALEFEITEGWTDYGQTNHLLKQIACYGVVFLGLKGEALVENVQHTASHCPGYGQWCRHQHEIALRCKVWARAAEGYYWPLGTEGTRRGNIHCGEGANATTAVNRTNQARSEDAQARITQALDQLKREGQLALYNTKTALENAIVRIARCSKNTTQKYSHLWYIAESKATEQVCTTDAEPIPASLPPNLTDPSKSLKSSSEEEVHTQPYMKGREHLSEFGSDSSQISFPPEGTGGLSTALALGDDKNSALFNMLPKAGSSGLSKNDELHQPVSSLSNHCPPQPTPSDSSPRRQYWSQPKLINSSSINRLSTPGSTVASTMPSEALRHEFGKLAKQMGWSLEHAKEFIKQLLGKTLQTLAEEDWLLLVYQMRNLMSSS
ncbi:hypothetical protein H6F88_02475 [Oculatella sp. FACHB-28]|uniref:hypothetical protein n=1 Tax=Oculatella sp. FACHB-28 TaxID=2692845 RepID=UPI0016838AB0|nr:hypothetical protein [Oculatella sp. FACHB-28]MBD2054894.1 hypothetical protein [Oculatella sp. FACHB-28]